MAALIPYLIVGIGAWVLYAGTRRLLLARQSKTWPWVEGEIISSDVKREPRRNWGDRQEAPRTYIVYSANIRFSYEVNGMTYVSDTISLDAGKNYFDYRRGVVETLLRRIIRLAQE